MENVFSLPTANISNFFYKRKFIVFHLTAQCSISKKNYSAVWSELISGQTGNDIASALLVILDQIVADESQVTEICLWSDSCVPQNRNSFMTIALKIFMQNHPQIKTIIQKFCEPGHSVIQEIDSLHGIIERNMEVAEVYSPICLARILKYIPRKNPIKLIQIKEEQMMDFQTVVKNYSLLENIPYAKVKILKYSADKPWSVEYKTEFSSEWKLENIFNYNTRHQYSNNKKMANHIKFVQSKVLKKKEISIEKVNDLKSMLKLMPLQDKEYMSSVLQTFT